MKPENNQGRREALERRLWAAIELDGHPDGVEMVTAVATCSSTTECDQLTARVRRISETCEKGGHALRFLNGSDLDHAESWIEKAEELAKKWGPIRKQAREQQDQIVAAVEACEKDRSICKVGCDNNDPIQCTAYGAHLKHDGKFDEARTALKKGCDGKLETSCNLLKALDEDVAKASKEIDAAWSAVVQAGDEIATKKFLMAFASKNLTGTKNAQATKRMGEHITALKKDSYCPALKAFLGVSTPAEFTTRAKEHCNEHPPTAVGLSGTDEPCTAECQATFVTTGCP